MIRAVQICEYEVVGIVEEVTAAEMETYKEGFADGANQYGAGSAGVYTLEDAEEMEASANADDRKTAALVRKALEAKP